LNEHTYFYIIQAGRTLFLSLADEEGRRKNGNRDRFEEILEEDNNVRVHHVRRDIHEFMRSVYIKFCANFKEHPFVSGTTTLVVLPFIGLFVSENIFEITYPRIFFNLFRFL
jgi:hypothetical protein